MPELPEVETVRRGLAVQVVGRTFTGVSFVEWPRTIEQQTPAELSAALAGQQVTAVERRAKFLVVRLASGQALTIHLRMTGQVTIAAQDRPHERFVRIAFGFTDGDELRFSDIRRFGRIGLYDQAGLADRFQHLGPEPLADDWTATDFVAALGQRRTRLKPLLLDQSFLAGLGNIYADEALFRAQLHPRTSAAAVTPVQGERLYAAIRALLGEAIASGGTTFSNYRDAYGNSGDYYERRQVYARTDEPCPNCGTPISRIMVGGRSTHFCPTCQPAAPTAGAVLPFPQRPAQATRLVAEAGSDYHTAAAPETDEGPDDRTTTDVR